MEYRQSIGAANILPIAFSRTIEAHGIAASIFTASKSATKIIRVNGDDDDDAMDERNRINEQPQQLKPKNNEPLQQLKPRSNEPRQQLKPRDNERSQRKKEERYLNN